MLEFDAVAPSREVGGSVEELKEVHGLRDGEPVMHFRIATATETAVVPEGPCVKS